jgi:DnaA family protein
VADQLALALALQDHATFDNFWQSSSNRLALRSAQTLAAQPGPGQLHLVGPEGSGRSHLLQAVCHQLLAAGETAVYLPLALLCEQAPAAVLEGLDAAAALCLDDLHGVLGDPAWDEALFHLYNRLRERGGRWLSAAHAAPGQLRCSLPDLRSRLGWGLVCQLAVLGDDERCAALQWRARRRGLDISDEVARFILHRAPRDLASLFELLERLDRQALAHKRRLTIPFLKSLLDW